MHWKTAFEVDSECMHMDKGHNGNWKMTQLSIICSSYQSLQSSRYWYRIHKHEIKIFVDTTWLLYLNKRLIMNMNKIQMKIGVLFRPRIIIILSQFLTPILYSITSKAQSVSITNLISMQVSYLVMWKNDKSTTTRWFNDNRQKFRIYSAKCWVPATFRHTNIIITLFTLQSSTVNMSKFRRPHNPKGHFDINSNDSLVNSLYSW